MNLFLVIANSGDAATIAAIKNESAQHLTLLYGKGHWSYQCTEKGVLYDMQGNSKILVAKNNEQIVGTLRLTSKKPWAIDINYFTKVEHPLYLAGMDVRPDWQRKGIGRYMMEAVKSFVVKWPAQSIRLDAYDSAAGAGEFYHKCGYTERGRVLYKNNPLIYFEWLA